jgi:hypothetical protein
LPAEQKFVSEQGFRSEVVQGPEKYPRFHMGAIGGNSREKFPKEQDHYAEASGG